ncbi:right-handed parallel beta-helix repeat-containing protein [Prauserella oleivorans]|uniref:Right-handed parallel beta-helix repeat-containing protein n=1 Tax=Prauserella oleivorans TaxID=1478153 RepID=A0ABW5W306_9PSEU
MTVVTRALPRALIALLAGLAVLLAGCTGPDEPAPEGTTTQADGDGAADDRQRARVCGNTRPGPASAPGGAVTVDPSVEGDLVAKTEQNPPGTTFWLAPGTHRLGDGQYDQVIPKDGNTYVGAPGAVVDGQRRNQFAFTQHATDVTIRHLEVRNFVPPHNQGVVNHDSGDGWVIEHNTLRDNEGAALMAGARQQVRGNCLRDNGQYALNAYQDGDSITDLVLEGNEITGNNTGDWENRIEGCGCTGGVKFWAIDGGDVRGNWIHDNRGPGLWADTNNNDLVIENNVIERNDGAAIIYETSYNAVIRGNLFRENNWVDGRDFADRGDNFPVATVYISESGGEPRVPARTDQIAIYDNVFENNWSGITAWENADRFCSSPADTSGVCTRLEPNERQCMQPAVATEPQRGDCRWKTQRLAVHDNRFLLDPNVVDCESWCARMALLSNYGTYPEWSPFQGEVVQEAITFHQQNRWWRNSYVGPWRFVVYDTGTVVDPARWQSAPYRQDQGSTFSRSR